MTIQLYKNGLYKATAKGCKVAFIGRNRLEVMLRAHHYFFNQRRPA